MHLTEMPKDTNVTKVPLRVPANVLAAMRENYRDTPEVLYYAGWVWGTLMLSPEPPGTKGPRRLYPVPEFTDEKDLLYWEIAQ